VLGEAGANIIHVSHQRSFCVSTARAAHLSVVIETRDRAHRDQVMAGLRAWGFQGAQRLLRT